MNWSKWIRRCHRVLSILFVAVVAAIFAILGAGREPLDWVYYTPLAPLALLAISGLYMFVLPYAVQWRGGRAAGAEE